MATQRRKNQPDELHEESGGTVSDAPAPKIELVSVTASRAIRVNVTRYEHYDTFASVTLQVSPETDIVDIREAAKDYINALQADELNHLADYVEKQKVEESILFHMFE